MLTSIEFHRGLEILRNDFLNDKQRFFIHEFAFRKAVLVSKISRLAFYSFIELRARNRVHYVDALSACFFRFCSINRAKRV